MKNSANGNMYEVTLSETRELFAPYVSGAYEATAIVVCSHPLSETAKTALCNSTAARGYGRNACTFITLEERPSEERPSLDESALFLLIEGLDPLIIIATDKVATAALERTYHQALTLNAANRLFGRSLVAFTSFEDLLNSAHDKQVAWALLKKLPKFGD
ncbi:MAG: hypothetical protein VB027_05195 [Gordonibacter sp.]|nr:hypothetical protein [Gordonibacter sp.]